MEVETRVVIRLTDRDVQRARANSGLAVALPPRTTEVVIRVVEDDPEGAGEGRDHA
jgi:hypothetical protein